jgi:hypothetical protein
MSMGRIDVQANNRPDEDGQANPVLAEHAAVIRRLSKRVVGDIIEIGRRLTQCRNVVGHGHWHHWLDAEFGWSEQTALNYMRVHEMAKSKNFLDLDIPISALHLLAAPNTAEEACDEIIERAKAGEHIPLAVVKETIARPQTSNKSNRTPRTVNPKPLPDIVDGCVAAVRRRIEDTVLEQTRYRAKKRRPQLERLFAGLTDTIEDLEHNSLAVAEDDAAGLVEKHNAFCESAENGSEAVVALRKPGAMA